MPQGDAIHPAPPSRLAPLNIFQYLARQWDNIHPYNAAQTLEINGVPDLNQINDAWTDTLAAIGLGRVRLTSCGHFGFEVLNGEMRDYPVRRVPAATSLTEFLTAEINRPFADPGEPPFRAFVRQGEGSYHLGVVYQHWTADSVSVQGILRELFYRLYDPSRVRQSPQRIQDTGYWGMYGPRHGRWKLDENLFGLARRYFRYRRVRKVQSAGLTDPAVRIHMQTAPADLIDGLRAAGSAAGVKVHDIIVAALAEACAQHVPTQFRKRRRDLAVGSIIDLRPLSRTDLTDVFGLYLGFTGIIVHEGDLAYWPRLLKSVATQNRHHKNLGIPQTSLAWMLAARLIGQFVPRERLWHFYRKEMPLSGGLSNMNLSKSWATAYAPNLIRDYIRVSPTGPLAPLAVATTTFAGTFRAGVTYRSSLIDDGRAGQFLETFISRLKSVAAPSGSPVSS
ncbi:MAG TPA: hypothetical protein VGN72_21165 [Tepidisphaeraceae bacterium]|jgi:NRPS condensation-like uncharacterized protein|nr:hypothetical protein [Tepidisphaeraceae bacterium]